MSESSLGAKSIGLISEIKTPSRLNEDHGARGPHIGGAADFPVRLYIEVKFFHDTYGPTISIIISHVLSVLFLFYYHFLKNCNIGTIFFEKNEKIRIIILLHCYE